MDGSIFFVHGTGNWDGRKTGASGHLASTLEAIRRGLANAGMSRITVTAPEWARDLGPNWPDVSRALPPAPATRAIGGDLASPDDADYWDLLLRDPLVELRLAGLGVVAESRPIIGAPLPAQRLGDLTRGVALADADLAAAGIDPAHVTTATGLVADSDELAAAANTIGTADESDLLDIVARAVVACILVGYRNDLDVPPPVVLLSGAARSNLVTAVRAALPADHYKGIVPKPIQHAVAALAESIGTRWAVARRDALMSPVTAFTADIAFYLRHGDEVRDYLRTRINNVPPPRVLLGHSLGGVALVDLLSVDDRPQVDLLITVGSQAPYLYLLDALANLRPQSCERKPFSPWLNIYNRRDLLSFCAATVFSDVAGVQDVAIDPGVPFPESHGAYWDDPATWVAVGRRWPHR